MKLKKSICKRLLVCMRKTIAPSLTPNSFMLPNHEAITLSAALKRVKFEQKSILSISHLYIDKACAGMS